MKRAIILVISVLLIGGVIYLHRIFSSPGGANLSEMLEDDGYHLNDSLCNAMSDFPAAENMERYIKRWMARNNIRGASLAIMRDEKLIYCKGLGWADQEIERQAEAKDIYRMASASKLITAVGIMKLCEQGLLNLDDRVFGENGILKQFTSFKDKRVADITVRQLLNHTSGFSRSRGDLAFRVADVMEWTETYTTPSTDDLIAYQLSLKLRCTPGGSAQYSNMGYIVLSRVIEQVSGMNYESYLQENVLKPAGCYDMHLAYNYYEQRHPGEVKYYGHDDERIESYDGSGMLRPREYGGNNIRGLQGAGAWVASSAELMRLVASIDGQDGVTDILSKESIDEMKCVNGRTLGWADYVAGNDALVRTGTMSGTCAYIYLRNKDLSFVFLTNTSHYRGATFTTSMGRMVRDAMARVKEWPTDIDLFVGTPPLVKSDSEMIEHGEDLS